MDVPISLGITLATAMSLFQTIRGTEQVYFDAAVMPTFSSAHWALSGRVGARPRPRCRRRIFWGLARRCRQRLSERMGLRAALRPCAFTRHARVQVAAGERIPVDGRILDGSTGIDSSLITGETIPVLAGRGSMVHAGTLNLGHPILVEATATDDNTLVASNRPSHAGGRAGAGGITLRLADRAARLYAPAVHLLGATTFLGWMLAGAGWEQALTCAIAVLIITCPCALALAVPAVQVAGDEPPSSQRHHRQGRRRPRTPWPRSILSSSTRPAALPTRGEPSLKNGSDIDDVTPCTRRRACRREPSSLCSRRRQGRARAWPKRLTEKRESLRFPAQVFRSRTDAGREQRLRLVLAWAVGDAAKVTEAATLWYAEIRRSRRSASSLMMRRVPMPRASSGVLRDAGFAIELLSGDREQAVRKAARATGIDRWSAGVRPDGKIARIESLGRGGRRALMVGDGLNDAPALAAAHASLSPSSAADISQNAADAVFQGEARAWCSRRWVWRRPRSACRCRISASPSLTTSSPCRWLWQGHVTPLIAALAMSLSSIAVTGNALRLEELQSLARSPGSFTHGANPMTALAWLIPCALVLGLLGLVAFLWALNSGQFEDLDGAGWRAIQDDDDKP